MSGLHAPGSMWCVPGTTMRSSAWTRTTSHSTDRNRPSPPGVKAMDLASSWRGHSATRGGRTRSEGSGASPAAANLSDSYRYTARLLSGTGSAPVSGARLSTRSHRSGEARLITTSGRSARLRTVWLSLPRPRTTCCPSAQADEMGARLKVPSAFSVVSRTTGVPK